MNLGLVNTVPKLRAACASDAVWVSGARLGSRKKISTPTNITKTLSAATRKTFSTLIRW